MLLCSSQGYELYVSIIAVNATTQTQLRGFYYQGKQPLL